MNHIPQAQLVGLVVGALLLVVVFLLRKIVRTLKSTALLLLALGIFWGFGYETVAKRLFSQVEGTVISRRDIADSATPRRYSTEYIVCGLDGQNHSYVAGPTDASLPRTIPVGANVKKLRWHWSYEQNGQLTDQFGWVFYGVVLAMGALSLLWSLRLRNAKIPLS